jgi:salicylate hydroxylase
MSKPHILITGGGIGGLCAALALLKRGFDVDVYEQAAELKEVGAGLQLSPNGNRVLFELGLKEQIESLAAHPTGKEIRLWNSGQIWKLFDLGGESIKRYGYPYFMMHRADLLQVLIDGVRACKPDAIHLNHRVSGFDQDEDKVTLHFEKHPSVTGDVVVGADGVHSRIRQGLFGQDAPVFTGCVAWRGVVPMEKLPARLRRSVGTNWVGPGAHVIHYPLRGGQLMNFVGIVERDDWQVESWTETGTIEECARDFAGWNEDVHEIIRQLDKPHKWALMGRQPLARWSKGRATLLGDSCHPTLPFLAQGAIMAIEDGLVLARCVEAQPDRLDAALRDYEELRKERTAKIVRGSAENAKRFHANVLSTEGEAQTYIEREWSEPKIIERYSWLFEYDATSVAVGELV